MKAGGLNRRVTIQSSKSVSDDYGQPIKTWEDVATVWANVRFLNGREYTSSGKEVGAATVSVRVRYRTDVRSDMRILFGDSVLNVKAVLADEAKHEHVDLACEVGMNDG